MKPTSLSQLTDNIMQQLDGMIDKGKYQQVWDIVFYAIDLYIKDSVNREPEFVGGGYSLKMDMDKTTQLVKGFCARFNVEPGQVFDAIRNDLNMKMINDTGIVTIRKDDILPAEMLKTKPVTISVKYDDLLTPETFKSKMDFIKQEHKKQDPSFLEQRLQDTMDAMRISPAHQGELADILAKDKMDYDETPDKIKLESAGVVLCDQCGMYHMGTCAESHAAKVEYMTECIKASIDPNPNTKVVSFGNYGRPKAEGIGSIIDAVVDGKIPEPPKEMILHLKPKTNTIAEYSRLTENEKLPLFLKHKNH